MSRSPVRIQKVIFSAPSRGVELVEYVVGTDHQINDYMIGQASSLGCICDNFPVCNDGGLMYNVSDINQLKVL